MTVTLATDLWRMGAVELADAIRTRRASSAEVVESHLQRIEAVNPAVNAVVVVMAEQARTAAAAADRAATREDLPPFHGVPFTVKGNIDVAGTPTTQGLKAYSEAFPTGDAPIVERVKAAGGIPIGRTNLPSAAMRWHCESELWGATLNPWDSTRTPGASSAGEAVAVATGMSPLGLGSDGLGSLRHPAQCCGIAALKPTLGRVPQASSLDGAVLPISIQLTTVNGPLARHVADLAAAFEVLAGPTWQDPWTVPAPLRGPDPAEPLRVAMVLDPGSRGTAGTVQDGVQMAGRALEDAGFVVDCLEPPGIDAAARALLVMDSAPGVRAVWDRVMKLSAPENLRVFVRAFFRAAGYPDAVATEEAYVTRHALMQAWGAFQERYPLIVAPVSTEIPRIAGTDLAPGGVEEDIRAMRMTMAVNALGLPAVAVPVGIAQGLPQGVQVIGPAYREDLCLRAAAAIEERLGAFSPIDPHG